MRRKGRRVGFAGIVDAAYIGDMAPPRLGGLLPLRLEGLLLLRLGGLLLLRLGGRLPLRLGGLLLPLMLRSRRSSRLVGGERSWSASRFLAYASL